MKSFTILQWGGGDSIHQIPAYIYRERETIQFCVYEMLAAARGLQGSEGEQLRMDRHTK